MPYSYATITTHTTQVTAQSRRIAFSTRLLNAEVARSVVPAAQARLDVTLNKDPGAHRHLKGEMTPKQLRWWWAVGVKRWTGRTGKARAWKIVAVYHANGGEIYAENPVSYSRYLFKPPYKQRMHSVWLNSETYAAGEGRRLALKVGSAYQGLYQP